MDAKRFTSDELRAIAEWLLANERSLHGMEISVRVAHTAINAAIQRSRVRVSRKVSFSTFARVYLYLRTTGRLSDCPLTRGRGDDHRQALFPFALEAVA
jgi:hypothetical protein